MITNLVRPVLHGMASLVFPPTGRHRQMQPLLLPDQPVTPGGAKGSVLAEATLLELVPEAPVVAVGAVVATCFDDCPNCGKATAGVLTKDGWRCGECLTPVPAGGAS